MPYLTQKAKDRLAAGEVPRNAGELTYCLTMTIQWFLGEADVNYERLSQVLGAIEGCKADFTNRVLIQYEAQKCEDNGDVWE